MINKWFGVLAIVAVLSSCGGASKDASTNTSEKESEISGGKEPTLFPFELNEKELVLIGKRKKAEGDCTYKYSLQEIGEKRIYMCESQCSEYTSETIYYYFEAGKLIAVHRKSVDNTVDLKSGNLQVLRTEETSNFRNKTTFSRADTVPVRTRDWIQKDFMEVTFADDRKKYMDSYEDVLTPRSYTSKSKFNLNDMGATEGDSRMIYLQDPFDFIEFDLFKASNFIEITNFKSNGIPSDVAFAFSTWWAGGGRMVYGKVVSGVLKIYQRFDEESLPMGDFHLLRVIDPEVRAAMPAYYIEFKEDKGKAKNLQVAFSESGEALFVKYEGQERHIQVATNKDQSQGATIKILYDEIIHGVKAGSYLITHQGNYDYVKYTAKNGKVFNYTIDFDKSLIRDSYRTTPNF